MKTLLYQKLNGYLNKKFGLLKKNNYICKHMATVKNVLLVHPKHGEILNETFVDEIQFKIFLNMVHASLSLKEDFTTFNGKDFLIHIPFAMLKESLILGTNKEVSMAEVVVAKSKLEG
jgi:hypothetical protein